MDCVSIFDANLPPSPPGFEVVTKNLSGTSSITLCTVEEALGSRISLFGANRPRIANACITVRDNARSAIASTFVQFTCTESRKFGTVQSIFRTRNSSKLLMAGFHCRFMWKFLRVGSEAVVARPRRSCAASPTTSHSATNTWWEPRARRGWWRS